MSHRSVAARAGVPLGSTTYYFTDLDELRAAAAEETVASWLARGAAEVAAAGRGSFDVRSTARLVIRALLPDRDPARILGYYEQLLGAARHPAVAAVLGAGRGRLEALVAEVLKVSGRGGRVDPGLVLSVVDGAVLGALSEGRREVVEVAVAAVADLLAATNSG